MLSLLGPLLLSPFDCWIDCRSTASAQSFDLLERNGQVSGRILIEQDYLTIFNASESPVGYQRDRRYDSDDGEFIGFYNAPLARILKFPRRGRGHFLYADLDEPIPVDRFSNRTLRETGTRRPVPVHPRYLDPAYRPATGFGPRPEFSPLPGFGGQPIIPGGVGGLIVSPLQSLRPQSTLLESNQVPLPPLPPAELELLNGGQREIQVTLTDANRPGKVPTMRIKPGEARQIRLPRDAGSELIQRYEVVTPAGGVVIQDKTRLIPPEPRYQVTVHQWRVQSVSIDRTLPGGAQVDDVNIQGQAVGTFTLPPGPELQSGTIDVFQQARQMQNQGAIAPLVPNASTNQRASDKVSPLERSLLNLP